MKENLVCGLEPVFQLVQRDGKVIDMLKNAMRVKEPMLKAWLDDLLVLGVHDGHGQGGRLPICKYDEINLLLSGIGVFNSCSEEVKESCPKNVAGRNQVDGTGSVIRYAEGGLSGILHNRKSTSRSACGSKHPGLFR